MEFKTPNLATLYKHNRKINTIINNSTPEQLVKFFTNLILETTEKTIEKYTNCYNPKVPWWNEKIKTI